MHTAHSGETITRTLKDSSGHWTKMDISIPPGVKDYNWCMGGVDVSDALIGYYQVLHKTRKWYKTFFYHFIDIAIVNAFLLHKELCTAKGQAPMTQKAFRETLAEQLKQMCCQEAKPPQPEANKPESPQLKQPNPSASHHRLQYISGQRSEGRQRCRLCNLKTAVKCSTCDKPLCFIPPRDCYNKWHDDNNM
ncbi:piggyBac transposable element-derived protein 4-like [Poecilia reticulata]|nr:PREDICTED: piggyBac transposable element-derived protein 4-like [Poecilia reticulata]